MESRNQFLSKVQENYGKGILISTKCAAILEDLLNSREVILNEFKTNDENLISETLKVAKQNIENINIIFDSAQNHIESIRSIIEYRDQIENEATRFHDRLKYLETSNQYLRIMCRIENINIDIEREYCNQDWDKCVTIFCNLCDIHYSSLSLKNTYLKEILYKMMEYWHEVLKQTFSMDFKKILDLIKWPFIANSNIQNMSSNNLETLQLFTEYLFQIELPSEADIFQLNPSTSKLSTPVFLLIQPFRKRFQYHFFGSKQTNRCDKPEWYFTQILTWIRDHVEFLEKYIQPVADKLGLYHIDVEGEFIVGLAQQALEKLQSDMLRAQFDDYYFSHLIDEALSFDKELKDSYNYSITQNGIQDILTQTQVLMKWINIEKKIAIEKLDIILSTSSKDPFELLPSDVDSMKITFCADAFMTLLKRITDRSESLPKPAHKTQFLQIQLDLLDDFRIRLIQIANAEEGNIVESKIPMIVNTLFYVETVLDDWSTNLHFLSLFHHISQSNSSPQKEASIANSETTEAFKMTNVFSETFSLYSHLKNSLLSTLYTYVINEMKNKSKAYRRLNWGSMEVKKDIQSLSLSTYACLIFEVLMKRLHQLEKTLSDKLFFSLWKSIASLLDNFLFEDLVLLNKFNANGALQFRYDIEMCLFSLFSQYTDCIQLYFPQLSESICILNLAGGSAILLKEALLQLEGATGIEDTRKIILKDVGIEHFSSQMVLKILACRMDLHSDLVLVD